MQSKTIQASREPDRSTKESRANLITKCLTQRCIDCSGSYVNKLIGYKLQCKCKCHNKKTLEQQQVVEPWCSNVSRIQPNQQPGGLLNG
jgi:hypothetical protein